MIARLLEKEARFFSPSLEPVFRSDPWREKVIRWFFSVVFALARNRPAGVPHPFDRATVHVSTALLDNFLASLPQEQRTRYKSNRVAYQVLATTCLLLGIRLVHSHQRIEAIRLQQQQPAIKDEPTGEMRRTGKLQDLQHASAANEDDSLELPNIRSILRISAASKSISEATVLTMVREVTSSRIFPRSHSVTALDFIKVFATRNSSNHTSSSNGSSLHLEPTQERNASLLADAALYCSRCKPSIAACAAITVAKMRSAPQEDVASVRQLVFQAMYGEHDDSVMQSVRDVEIRLLEASAALLRNGIVPRPLSSHVIPQED